MIHDNYDFLFSLRSCSRYWWLYYEVVRCYFVSVNKFWWYSNLTLRVCFSFIPSQQNYNMNNIPTTVFIIISRAVLDKFYRSYIIGSYRGTSPLGPPSKYLAVFLIPRIPGIIIRYGIPETRRVNSLFRKPSRGRG